MIVASASILATRLAWRWPAWTTVQVIAITSLSPTPPCSVGFRARVPDKPIHEDTRCGLARTLRHPTNGRAAPRRSRRALRAGLDDSPQAYARFARDYLEMSPSETAVNAVHQSHQLDPSLLAELNPD